jgi:hypothetical protein
MIWFPTPIGGETVSLGSTVNACAPLSVPATPVHVTVIVYVPPPAGAGTLPTVNVPATLPPATTCAEPEATRPTMLPVTVQYVPTGLAAVAPVVITMTSPDFPWLGVRFVGTKSAA